LYSFHYVLIEIMLEKSVINVYDSLRRDCQKSPTP